MPATLTVASSNPERAVLESVTEGLAIRRAHFPDRMRFHTGLTAIAEKIGHLRFHELLNRFCYDISDPISRNRGEI